jgi:hypothetical protein
MIHIHRWFEVDRQYKYKYMQCVKCGKRKVMQSFIGGYQPMKYPLWERE